MDSGKVPQATGDCRSIESFLEMEYRFNSLQSVVCDLLKANQELRDALKARSGEPNQRGS